MIASELLQFNSAGVQGTPHPGWGEVEGLCPPNPPFSWGEVMCDNNQHFSPPFKAELRFAMTQTQIESTKLRFIHHTGRFVELTGLIDIAGEDAVKAANIQLLQSFGCTDQQIDEGWEFLKSINLSSTFNSWANDDEGSSGISAKALVSGATTPGAVLTLVGLLRKHPDAKASGMVSINYSNPTRGASGRAR